MGFIYFTTSLLVTFAVASPIYFDPVKDTTTYPTVKLRVMTDGLAEPREVSVPLQHIERNRIETVDSVNSITSELLDGSRRRSPGESDSPLGELPPYLLSLTGEEELGFRSSTTRMTMTIFDKPTEADGVFCRVLADAEADGIRSEEHGRLFSSHQTISKTAGTIQCAALYFNPKFPSAVVRKLDLSKYDDVDFGHLEPLETE